MAKPPLIVIVGPTAAGKSWLAVRLAKKFNGEIVSADSRQIYRGLDIGTGKVPGTWRIVGGRRRFLYWGIAHHCIDFVSPRRQFSVAEFKRCADRAIRDIAGRGKLAILAGGTGFWVDAVARGLELPRVPPDEALRRRLAEKSARKLLATLRRLDPERAKTVEPKNPRRLIRAIEIAKTLGRVPKLKKRSPYRLLWIGLAPLREKFERAIKARISAMLRPVTKSTAAGIVEGRRYSRIAAHRDTRKTGNFVTGLRGGLIQETKTLASRVREKRIREFGFEYRAALAYLGGRLRPAELREHLIRDTHRYARRQLAWWKRNPEIHWVDKKETAERFIRQFLNKTT